MLLDRYLAVRAATERLAEPLTPEDVVVQSMPDASPTKWHLAHTTWFFETFVLTPRAAGYRAFDPRFGYLFNSYYEGAGERHARPRRGLLTRPSIDEVRRYRAHVDERMTALLREPLEADMMLVVETGLHHEQQHQELILTDILHAFGENPLRPAYRSPLPGSGAGARAQGWVRFEEGLTDVGHDPATGFSFDNERPRHRAFLDSFELADRLVTAGEMISFIEDGGYREPLHWLSEGWDTVQREAWSAPLGWTRDGSNYAVMTLAGMREVDPAEPVCRLSFFEADAYARWAGARLPTEEEWEHAARGAPISGETVDSGRLHPSAAPPVKSTPRELSQLYGDVWEWTASAYRPYPGFRPLAGTLGEYNGKFMSGQMVLRGGSCLTPRSHLRATYRNFFPPGARWQMTGLRLARD